MFDIYIPKRLTDRNVASFYQNIIDNIKLSEPDKVNFDFTKLEFIDPSGIVTLWNMVDLIGQEMNCEVYYNTPSDYIERPFFYKAVDYLDDSLFFEKVMGEKLHPNSSERTTTNGLEKLRNGEFNQRYINQTIEWLKWNVGLKDKSFSFLETALGEIFNNINDHSKSAVGGCAFAQHFPNKNQILLCVADAGMGIANRMKTTYTHDKEGNPLIYDSDFINYSTGHKVSTKTTPQNRGLGLETLIRIMENNQGSLRMLSNEGSLEYNYKYDPKRFENKRRLIDHNVSYQGTLVVLCFRTDTLEKEEEEEELIWDF